MKEIIKKPLTLLTLVLILGVLVVKSPANSADSDGGWNIYVVAKRKSMMVGWEIDLTDPRDREEFERKKLSPWHKSGLVRYWGSGPEPEHQGSSLYFSHLPSTQGNLNLTVKFENETHISFTYPPMYYSTGLHASGWEDVRMFVSGEMWNMRYPVEWNKIISQITETDWLADNELDVNGTDVRKLFISLMPDEQKAEMQALTSSHHLSIEEKERRLARKLGYSDAETAEGALGTAEWGMKRGQYGLVQLIE